jgi:hypothetical protein
MKNLTLTTLLLFSLSGIASAEEKMQNSNPSPEPKAEPVLGHHMQNRDPSPKEEVKTEPTLGYHMQNRDPSTEPETSPTSTPEPVMKNATPK